MSLHRVLFAPLLSLQNKQCHSLQSSSNNVCENMLNMKTVPYTQRAHTHTCPQCDVPSAEPAQSLCSVLLFSSLESLWSPFMQGFPLSAAFVCVFERLSCMFSGFCSSLFSALCCAGVCKNKGSANCSLVNKPRWSSARLHCMRVSISTRPERRQDGRDSVIGHKEWFVNYEGF